MNAVVRGFRRLLWRFEIVGDVFAFLWQRRLWWLLPLVFVLLFFSLLIILGQATGLGPFIYTLF